MFFTIWREREKEREAYSWQTAELSKIKFYSIPKRLGNTGVFKRNCLWVAGLRIMPLTEEARLRQLALSFIKEIPCTFQILSDYSYKLLNLPLKTCRFHSFTSFFSGYCSNSFMVVYLLMFLTCKLPSLVSGQ